ncbi:MAG: hypothetical protein IJI96_03310 [Methanobrevibacter sp.]|nr:hypothetical protein [Methanobrevibacter sp.]
MSMLETDLTSDILIYNLLRKTDDEFIQEFNIKFIDRSVPAEESNTIYIANMDLELRKETFHSAEYNALINIFIKTKNTDYLEGSQYLRTVAKHIKNVLKGNVTCRQRHIVFRNITYEYGSTYTLKGLHLIVQMNEIESMNSDDPVIIDKVMLENLETYVVSEELYWKEKNRQNKK